jgi:hydrogenase nickel incorporation protein HypA/HybF
VHEYSLVEALVRRVEDEARRRRALAVHAYETFRAGTMCEQASLELVRHPARWTCPTCGKAFARGDVLRCEACGEPARLDPNSDALLLESVDMEVP